MPRFIHGVLLFNGQAGQATAEETLSQVVPVIVTHCHQLTIVQTFSADEFKHACIEASYADVLFLMGGDGTLHTAVQVLENVDKFPIIGLLPGGTCNDFARTLGIPLSLNEAAHQIVNGMVREIDIAQINNSLFMNFAGIGLITEASENINPDLKDRYGKLSYFMSALQTFKQSEPFPIYLEIDGISYEEHAVMILVMNGKSIGTHRFPLEDIDPSDGVLDVLLIQSSTMLAIREWFSLAQPDVIPDDLTNVTHYTGQHIVIRTDEPKSVDTDGEIYLQTPIEIKLKAKSVQFLVPIEDE
ncbi:diacylglycerol kinase family protein [Paenisporosarcina sp. OV554]|uniref:diacylglycerol/lipid kinase family protein n=1 Tax=Paenisporosarcina sp. OV554 TaxID=2135694 RepID=UPI000D33EC30|nr:diacylglycerol kinase family protein [Paenisporosarcina sp. OV554]PUB13990.1 YegS/Rv2252/BmrU family lipid kinase [Paenisporosarcina sp. OV554]